MSDSGRPRANRERWASDHERARQRAAERLSLPLPAAENGWLDRHLRTCGACASVAAEYAAQQAALRILQEPLPPRDMWARTAAALDRAERQAGRDLPNPSVFPGRGGAPGSRGARSIRGLRAEQRASSFRSGPRYPGRRVGGSAHRSGGSAGLAWVAPFGALATLAILIVVGGGALLTGSPITPLRSPAAASATLAAAISGSPVATPIQVGAGEVVWLTPADDGSYKLNSAPIDKVCPAGAEADCAPIAASSPRNLPTVNSTLHTVIRSADHKHLVVVPSSTKRKGGGSIIVVAVPTQAPAAVSATVPPPTATVAPATVPPASPVETSVAPSSGTAASASPPPAPSAAESTPAETTPPPVSATESLPAASAATSEPTDASSVPPSTLESATPEPSSSVSLESSAPPASETASAAPPESAVPTEPQPTATAVSIITDIVVVGETASYSPDGTMLAFSARPANGLQGPDIYIWRPGDQIAQAVTFDHASVFSGWLNNQVLGSHAGDGSAPSTGSGAPTQPPASEGSSGDPFGAPSDAVPSVSESPSDAVPSFASGPPLDSSAPSPAATDSANTEGAVSVVFQADVPVAGLPRSFVLDPATGVETDLAAPAWRPVVDPSGRFVAYWAGSLRYDDATLTWIPDQGAIVLASWPALRGSDPNAILAPVPLLDNSGGAVPAGEWDIRWDESGTHVAIWAADAANPELGRLTLLTIDAAGRVDPTGISLRDAPALAGFSMGSDRLAWATPPGQDGEGSRLQVLAWSGENAGNIDSQPASGGDAVVVVR